MKINSYIRFITGECPERVSRMHQSTINRVKAYAIAMHIPVLIWAASGFIISLKVFNADLLTASAAGTLCALIVFLVERLVIATPKGFVVSLLRLALGILVAIMGASAVDLVLFEKEISVSLHAAAEKSLNEKWTFRISRQRELVENSYNSWISARDRANCEANGMCGSGRPSIGPIYRELAVEAAILRKDYEAAQVILDGMEKDRETEMVGLRETGAYLSDAGLLERIQALHRYTLENQYAKYAWGIFFSIMLFLELMVLFVKVSFSETVDDKIDRIREDLSAYRAQQFLENTKSPLFEAKRLLGDAS